MAREAGPSWPPATKDYKSRRHRADKPGMGGRQGNREGIVISSLHRARLLLSTAVAMAPLGIAHAQDPAGEEEYAEEITVTGQKPRGSVVGDIAPEVTFNAGDVRALGVSSIAEVLEELAPQTQSAGGGSPVVLLEGRRVASFREIGPIPTEAIQRVEILPEEVALKYGYAATQKVVNVVLRQRFRAFTLEGRGRLGTEGDGLGLDGRGGFLAIRRGQRLNLDVNYRQANAILEADRGLATAGGNGTDRTLTPETEALAVTATWAKPLGQTWLATLNGEFATNDSRSLRGSAAGRVTAPDGTAFVPVVEGLQPLQNTNGRNSGHLGLTLNATTPTWQWTVTGNYDHTETRAIQQRPLNLASYAAAVAAGDPLADPLQPLASQFLVAQPADFTRNNRDTADASVIGTTSPFKLPAGPVTTTFELSGSTDSSQGTVTRQGLAQGTSASREQGQGSINIDVPLSSRGVPLFPGAGRISLNGNAAVRQIGGYGTLRTFGGGLSWSPNATFSLIASYRDDQRAPTAAQFGDAVVTTANFDLFDYATGRSVRVTALTGGNPDLNEASQRNFRLGGTLRFDDPGITLNLDYNRTWLRDQVTALPGATPDVLAAFPERFVRNGAGDLVSVDLRPINIAREDRSQIRMGITFTKQLKTPQAQIDAMRESFQRRFPNGFPGRDGAGPGGERPAGDGPDGPRESGPREGGFGGRRGPGGGFGGGPRGRGGRLTFSVYHTWVLSDKAVLRAGQPEIDLLDGGTIGAGSGGAGSGGGASSGGGNADEGGPGGGVAPGGGRGSGGLGGTPRHQVQVQAGFSQSGLGVRVNGEWQSATRVDGIEGYPASQLRFGSLATVDLRLFADLGQRPKLVESVPFLRGARVTFAVNNLCDQRQEVRDGTGTTPLAYNPYYLDPVGRSFLLSLRKVFFSRPAGGPARRR
jgi:iron complex outermembrane recepter protein